MTLFTRQILGTKSAASKNWHPHYAEVIERDDTDFRRRLLAERNRWRAGHVEITVLFGVVEWTVRAHSGGLNARNALHALQQLRPERVLLLRGFVLRVGQCDFEVHHAMRIETERGILCMPETF